MSEFKFRAYCQTVWMYSDEVGMAPFWEAVAYNPTGHVMQFSGLHDKNRKEIYEGDIIRIASDGSKEIYEVKDITDVLPAVTSGEIIGNIYDIPEIIA